MRTVQLELLRPGEIKEEMDRISLVYLPVGPVEWHSYHMPMGTDAIIAQETARGLAKRTGGLVAPTLFVGTEKNDSREMLDNLNVPHDADSQILGMDFPKNLLPSLYYHEEVLAVVVREQMRLLAKMGFRMIVIVNGHGASGQVSVLRRLCDEVQSEQGVICLYLDNPSPRIEALFTREQVDPGHADRLETALMMHLTDSVDLGQLPARGTPMHSADFGVASGSQFGGRGAKDGTVADDPRDATEELGRQVMEADAEDSAPFVLAYYHSHVK